MTNSEMPIPSTPHVTSPSPAPSSVSTSKLNGSYFPTNSKSIHTASLSEMTSASRPPPMERSRTRDRMTAEELRRRRNGAVDDSDEDTAQKNSTKRKPQQMNGSQEAEGNGYLSPTSAAQTAGRYLRDFSRSSSPLGLIPIHRDWRFFIHRHEIPRKLLHVSIGFLSFHLYSLSYSRSHIHPVLLTLLLPIALTEHLRFSFPRLNTLYIALFGPLMRESEAHDRYNGVIWYLLGTWAVMRFLPTDVGTVAICLLSWCDTAASTVGRKWGRYTPKVARGKSLAGSLAACVVGVATAGLFWGWWAPRCERVYGVKVLMEGSERFAFQGTLGLPEAWRSALGWSREAGTVGGWKALAIMGAVAGAVASVSEAVDLWGLDDNVTIPVLAGLGLTAFLKVFGGA